MSYQEERVVSAPYKREYADGIGRVIEKRQSEAEPKRRRRMGEILKDPTKFRAEFAEMLGWPLTEARPATLPLVTTEELAREDGYTIVRMQFEVLEGLKMTGLLFRADGAAPKPLVLVQHGGQGTPEFIAGMYGETGNYNDMLQRVKKHGVHVFAPQLLLWHDDYEIPYDRVAMDARLKRVGSSITAVEIYGLQRVLDYFEAQDFVTCFGMVGLSYGGFYTLFTTALDTRIRSAVSCSFFNSRDAAPWCDWTWFCSAERFDDAEVACLVYPRRLCLAMGDHDELFDYRRSEESFEAIRSACREVGTEWTELIVFEGCHEFYKDDQPIKRLIEDLK